MMTRQRTRSTTRILLAGLVLIVLNLMTGFASAQPRDVTTAFFQEAKLLASDGAEYDNFGASVSISGTTMVAGAPLAASAYVFERDEGGTGDWAQVAKLTAADGVAFDRFGTSVSISGGTVVVGSTGDQYHDTGAAYVFERDAGGSGNWGQVAKLTASDGAMIDYFGYSVSISGETVVVGAPYDEDGGYYPGSAYLFEKPGDGWNDMVETVRLSPSDGAEGDRFGLSVSISGETVVVGAYRHDDEAQAPGSAYLFERDAGGSGNWGQVAKLTASEGVEADCFGCSVSISGDTVIVGAPYDNDGGDHSGSALLFEKPESGWNDMVETVQFAASDGGAGDAFGWSVSISGDTVVVGAIFADLHGSVYQFDWDAGSTVTSEMAKLTPSDGVSGDWFGWSASISGDIVAVGARGDDDNGEDSGSAYVFSEFEPVAWVYLPVVLRSAP